MPAFEIGWVIVGDYIPDDQDTIPMIFDFGMDRLPPDAVMVLENPAVPPSLADADDLNEENQP